MASGMAAFPAVDKATFVGLLKGHAKLSSDVGTWTDSGETAAGEVYNKTIGVFVHNFGDTDAIARLNDQPVKDYLDLAIRLIGEKAKDLADGGEVDGWHVRAAAKAVIKDLRKRCPKQIKKGTFETTHPTGPKWAHGDLCREFETQDE